MLCSVKISLPLKTLLSVPVLITDRLAQNIFCKMGFHDWKILRVGMSYFDHCSDDKRCKQCKLALEAQCRHCYLTFLGIDDRFEETIGFTEREYNLARGFISYGNICYLGVHNVTGPEQTERSYAFRTASLFSKKF